MRNVSIFAIVLLTCMQTAQVSAQTNDETYTLEPVVVSELREMEPQNSPYRLPESAHTATWVIQQKDIEKLQPQNIFDVLNYAPGMHISFQGRKAMNFLEARGGGDYAILLDGIYVPWTQSGRILANFPTDAIESVRVVRDSSILTLGPLAGLGSMGSAVQGFIIIKTRKPAQMENELTVGYGSLNRFKTFARHANKKEKYYYTANYYHHHDDGRDGWNNASNSDSLLINTGYEDNGWKTDLSLYCDHASREIQSATEISKVGDARWEYDPLDTFMFSGNIAKAWNAGQTTSIGIYTGRIDTDLHMESTTKPQVTVRNQEDNLMQADLRHIVTKEKNTFRVGGQVILWETPTGQFYYETMPRDEELYGLYVHDEYSLTDRVTIDAGARMDRKHINKGIDKYAPTQSTSALIEDKWQKPYYSSGVGVAYQPDNNWLFSFRTSYVEQGTDSYLTTVDDRSLDAEKQWRYEAGIAAQLHPAIRTGLTLFYYDIDNMKTSVGSVTIGDDLVNIYDTIDVGRKGLEVDIQGRLPKPALNYALTYSYQRSDNDTDSRTIPHHMASLRLGYDFMPFQANLAVKYVNEYESNFFAKDNKYHAVGDFTRIDANIAYNFELKKAKMCATLFGQNLTDERYETRLGWKDVGFTYGAQLSMKF